PASGHYSGCQAVQKYLPGARRRLDVQHGLADFIGFEQQVLPLVGRRGVGRAPQVAVRALDVARREPHHGEAAGLTQVPVRIPALALEIRLERLLESPAQKERVPEVVVAEDEPRG